MYQFGGLASPYGRARTNRGPTPLSRFCMVFEFGTALALAAASEGAAPTRIVEVPFTWSATQFGSQTLTRQLRNEGGSGHVEQTSGTFSGGFHITFSHSPPADYLERLDPLPDTVSVQLEGRVSGAFSNPSFDISLPFVGLNYQTYVGISASVDPMGAFPDREFRGLSSGSIQSDLATVRSVGQGDLDYAGSLNLSSLYGAQLFSLAGPITATVHLDVSANLVSPTTMVRYRVSSVPEPASTCMGSAAALMLLGGIRSRMGHSGR